MKNATVYFRNALAAAKRKGLKFKDNPHWKVTDAELNKGTISEDKSKEMFGKISPNEKLKMVIALKTLSTKFVEGEKINTKIGDSTAVFFLPVQLDYWGQLYPPERKEDRMPWIPREYLIPMIAPVISIGKEETYDTYLEKTTDSRNKIELWHDYLKYAMDLYNNVCEANFSYEDNCFIFKDERINSTYHILNLYNDIIKNWGNFQGKLLLYKRLIGEIEESSKINNENNVLQKMKNHVGQMERRYPLSASQRDVIHQINEMEEGDVLPVSGPPGTGKTTLLQSVVTSEFVKRALNKENPPIIVAVSANNQAVTNIIDSFSRANDSSEGKGIEDENPCLYKKWIRGTNSFATYFPSSIKMKTDEQEKYQCMNVSEKAFIDKIESPENLEASKIYFKENFESYYNKPLSDFKGCKEFLQDELKNINHLREDCLSLADSISNEIKELRVLDEKIVSSRCRICRALKKVKRICWKRKIEKQKAYLKDKIQCRYVSVTDNEFDDLWENFGLSKFNDFLDKIRCSEFWIAAHYYESFWLEELSRINENSYTDEGQELKNMYHRLAMVSPCMVMTFYMLPRQFKIPLDNNNYRYLYDFIDLLIVDEAGQVSPEIAVPASALAKKALVVGDEKQIPPVWAIQKSLDTALAIEYGMINEEKEFNDLISNGLNCSQSSILKRSFLCTRFTGEPLLLREHRRCYNEIISYCNSLMYDGKLIPLRGLFLDDEYNKIKKLYSPMQHINVSVPKSEKVGGSRQNVKEVETIIQWLNENFEKIRCCYPETDEKELVGIITPFKKQADLIKTRLNESGFGIFISAGTVHTFQGAERRIILFSSVYGGTEPCSFIEQFPNLMNVAVSRAKDSFIVFGDIGCLSEDNSNVSGLLKKMLNQSMDEWNDYWKKNKADSDNQI